MAPLAAIGIFGISLCSVIGGIAEADSTDKAWKQARTASAPAPSDNYDADQQIAQLTELLEKGLITSQQFQAAASKLLARR